MKKLTLGVGTKGQVGDAAMGVHSPSQRAATRHVPDRTADLPEKVRKEQNRTKVFPSAVSLHGAGCCFTSASNISTPDFLELMLSNLLKDGFQVGLTLNWLCCPSVYSI